MIKNPKTAAGIGIVLCFPAVALFVSMVLGMEPSIGPLASYFGGSAEGPNVPGSMLALFFFVIFPVIAFLINNFRKDKSRVNQAIAAASLGIVVAALLAVVMDQYPCWMGKPNCD